MTPNQPETPNNQLDRLELALGRLAELNFESLYNHGERLNKHDETLSRLEANATRHDEALSRLEANATRHDEALSRLEANATRHDEALSRLEANVTRHDETLNRLEGNIERLEVVVTALATQQQQTNRTLESLSQSQVECLQLIATNTVEMNRIWQYLERQTGNGRGGEPTT